MLLNRKFMKHETFIVLSIFFKITKIFFLLTHGNLGHWVVFTVWEGTVSFEYVYTVWKIF